MIFKILYTSLAGLLVGLIAFQVLTGCAAKLKREPSSDFSTTKPLQYQSAGTPGPEEDEPSEISQGVNIEYNKQAYAEFQWPVDQAKLSRGFLPNKRKPHLGIDLAAPKGTPILAAHDGVVIYTGRDFRGFGKMLMIEGGKGWATLYAHFSKIIAREGQKVKQGEVIGLMGRTGHATGNHLHFEVRSERGPVDPLDYLPNGALVAKLVKDRKKQAE